MNSYRRPWWLLVNKPPRLVTTITEENHAGERIFIIRGEPVVQGLAWLTWGPAVALATVALLTGLAITLQVKESGGAIQALFIIALLSLPALAWGGATLVLNRLSEKYLQAERQTHTREYMIRLNKNQGELFYQTTAQSEVKHWSYADIQRVRVTHPIGSRGDHALHLTLETNEGPVILLNETIGAQTQKFDLAHEIQEALKSYQAHKKSPGSLDQGDA